MSNIGSDHARLQRDCEIGYLEEIVINILSRLPVKKVVACKCVAKHWLRLISDPQFVALQLSESQRYPKYIICPYPRDKCIIRHLSLMEENGNISQSIRLPAFDNNSPPNMVCFPNGLICSVHEYEYEDEDELIDVDILIFNPITRDFLLLPEGTPSQTIPSVGLAFDPKTNVFKAFRFFSDSCKEDKVKYKCEAYTASSAEWRMISEDVERPESNLSNSKIPHYVSIAGRMYWFVWSHKIEGKVDHILSVDMKNNFTTIDLPTIMHELSFLIELEGCLSVVHLSYPDIYDLHQLMDRKPDVEIYKFSNEGWCLRAKFKIDLAHILCFNSIAARGNKIFFIIGHGNWYSFRYLIFDLNDGTWLTLNLADTFARDIPYAFPFAESLLKCT